MTGRLGIDDVTPVIGEDRYPAKAVVGEHLPIEATIWREGHDAVSATIAWRGPTDRMARQIRMSEKGKGLDRYTALIVPDVEGAWTFRVEAWSDPWATWLHAVQAKLEVGQGPEELANDLEIGARLIERVGRRPDRRTDKPLLVAAAECLRDVHRPLAERVSMALGERVRTIMFEFPVRELITRSRPHKIWVDRKRALFGSWYELFPRSTGGLDETGRPVHGTLATTASALDRIARMGFDVVYLPPIHPIGKINRKGPDNTLVAGPEDVGSPWAIGSDEGGHDAIHPALGTPVDFKAFVDRAAELHLEVALDLAIQCAPDHPWVTEHPEWFTTKPDGTIAYAENPPKRYQDIYPVNFDNDETGLYAELLRVVNYWVAHDVKIFRVDNPHTKRADFWHWLIWKVKQNHPDVLFLAEAFTRPARLYGLAQLGFTQSYTYFTWRTTKEELIEFGEEMVEHIDQCRPNLFVNTPDILHETLQHGGPAMFALRAALAATLSPLWGVYSGYELYEHEAVKEGSEEYLHSEKYELRPRDFEGALQDGRSLEPWLARLNLIRRAHPALQQLRTLTFQHTDHPGIVAYSKTDPATGDAVIVVVNLNPHEAAETILRLDMTALGMTESERFIAHDEVTGATWDWGQDNYVKLDPWHTVAHIVHVQRH